MDRQGQDFAAASAMAYAQQQRQAANIQQQQFGFHPQHQQFPPSVHGPPFFPPHPAPQQFGYSPNHLQQLPSHPSHPHLHHLQQQQPPSFPPHLPPHPIPPFHGLYDSPPPPAPPPLDPELHKRIEKLVEYAAKNGPEFEAMIREKQKDNPEYAFLFGGEGHGYYRYKLWLSTHPPSGPINPAFRQSSLSMHPPPSHMMSPSSLNAPPNVGSSSPMIGGSQLQQPPFTPFYEHHPHQFMGHSRPEYDQSGKQFKGLSGPLPSDVAVELNNVLNTLSGTKESIKGAKTWFMQRSPFAPALAEALRDRVFSVDDSERQLHIIYLVNDILFDSLQRRTNLHELDNEALAFKPVLGSMLARVYHNPQNKEENQSRIQKIIQFWALKEVYSQSIISALENEMTGGLPIKELSVAKGDSFVTSGILPQTNQNVLPGAFPESMPPSSSFQLGGQQPQPASAGEKLPPYPLFPPGLIPGMVRKMQIGSGVPYSPLSPLDIPTIIPPSDIPKSDILKRVSKFFKEIGEVNPCEGPMTSDTNDDDYEDYERVSPVRKGGACIPPPNLQVDPETGAYADGSVESKGSGRLGLGATANPNEVSQYDDVYTSYRKQRSTTYHSSISARSATR